MRLAQSKVTAQGRITIPNTVQRKLGIGPGTIIDWDEEGGRIIVRKAEHFSSEDIHSALFGDSPPTPRSLDELKAGTCHRMKKQFAGD